MILAAKGIAGAAYATGGGFIAFSCSVSEVFNVPQSMAHRIQQISPGAYADAHSRQQSGRSARCVVILAAKGVAGTAYATGGGFIAFSCSVSEVLNVPQLMALKTPKTASSLPGFCAFFGERPGRDVRRVRL